MRTDKVIPPILTRGICISEPSDLPPTTSPATHSFGGNRDGKNKKPRFIRKWVFRKKGDWPRMRTRRSDKKRTPAHVYYGRGNEILKERRNLKKIAVKIRRNECRKFKLATNKKTFLFELFKEILS